MKFLKSVFIVSMLLMAFLIFYAGDTYNVSGLGNGAEQFELVESFDQVMLKFSPYMAADSTGSFHSPPIFVGDCNNVDAYVSALVNATSDINVLYHVSNDLKNWTAVTPAGLDACSNTAKIDTIGASDSNASMFHHNNYLILEVDGQAGANTTDRLTLWVNFKKDGTYITGGGAVVKVARKIAASVTNP